MSRDRAEIRALDDRTVREIAAGEVVERPASVVKELVENALDAGAGRVSVTVERGGIDGIRVRDDGAGMPPDQLPKAVAKHATSKLGGIDDLDSGVATLGFRGEALHTVGAVAELTVRSRPPEADAGAELTVDQGDDGAVEPAGCPIGTTVEVRDLFGETPARRKFLRTPATEFDRINAVVSAYALATPDVAVSLEHDGREVFASNGDGNLRSAVLAVYGREVAESMVDVEAGVEDSAEIDVERAESSDAGVSVSGVVSHPETTRAGREYLTTFVNDRWVRDGDLRGAVVDAYGGQLAPDRYPFAALFVDVPADAVDVNVHPRKTEVRFDHDAEVVATVRSAVREALLDSGLVRSSAPRGRSAADEAAVDPEVVGGAGTDHERAAADARADEGVAAGADATPDTTTSVLDAWGGSSATGPERADDGDTADGETADDDAPDDSSVDAAAAADSPSDVDTAAESATGSPPDGPTGTESTDRPTDHPVRGPTHGASRSDRPSPRGWQEADAGDDDPRWTAPRQSTLAGGTTNERTEHDSLPAMRVLGQYEETYVVCETDEGLVLVDQHAADERVNYERLRTAARRDAPAQTLAQPVTLELTAREAELFETFRDALREVGFAAERAGDRTVAVTAVPAVFDATLDPDLLRDVLAAFADEVAADDRPVAEIADALLADLACYPSVTGNTSLTEGSVTDLLSALDDCENPYACPHGRPVLVEFGRGEITDRFERDYPGHAGRREE